MIDSEADTIRLIFRRYAELGSVRLLQAELEARGIRSKSWTSVSGRLVGGKPFSRGALYLMLQNRIYLGEIVHKGQFHPGEHTPILDQLLWDPVQAQLASNVAERKLRGPRGRTLALARGPTLHPPEQTFSRTPQLHTYKPRTSASSQTK